MKLLTVLNTALIIFGAFCSNLLANNVKKGPLFGFSVYSNISAAFSGMPITDEIEEGITIDVKYLDIVPYATFGIARNVTDNLSLVVEYSYLQNIKNPTDVSQPATKIPMGSVNVSSLYNLTTNMQGIYVGFDYYYTKKAFAGARLGVSYVEVFGDLVSDVDVTVMSNLQQYSIVSSSYGDSYAFSFKLTGGYDLFTLKNINFSVYSEYYFVYNSTVVDVSDPNLLADILVNSGYPTEFNTGMVNQGSLGIRVRY